MAFRQDRDFMPGTYQNAKNDKVDIVIRKGSVVSTMVFCSLLESVVSQRQEPSSTPGLVGVEPTFLP